MRLKRFYAHNFRCFLNFEIQFDELTLLLGPNGGGKSTLLELLFRVRRLVIDNARISEVFPPEDRTIWADSKEQRFELDVESEHGLFAYKLVISHDLPGKKERIDWEELCLNGKPLFVFKGGQVQLYRDDSSLGPPYSYDWTLSGLATIAPREDNTYLTAFKTWLQQLLIVHLQPLSMTSESHEESSWLDREGTNFASWYRYLSQEHQDKIFELTTQMHNVLPGFHAFKLEQAGKSRVLKVGFTNENTSSPFYLEFDRLSDGQRVLVVLYTLLFGLRDLGYTIFLDEPENYVSIEEIQPWLMELADSCGEGFPQALLISHHPEMIDYLGTEHGRLIDRDPAGHSRVRPMPTRLDDALKLSDQFARGWTE